MAFGIDPTHSEVDRLIKSKSLHLHSFNETLQFLNAQIFKNRQVAQREIIERAYFSVLKKKPTKEELEGYYAATNKKSKNFTELCNEIRSFFKSEIDYPE